MFHAKSISTNHKDLIHDVAYDFYGKRMATCSSDQVVKIFDLDENEDWICTSELKSHHASVWKVTWAHPEFGQIVATSSFDRSAFVWEESVGDLAHGIQSTWVRRASLVDSRSSVTDIKFAPKLLGLQLATCSADGVVRIYEATDVMNLNHWSVMHEIQTKLPSCSCLSWNPSPSRMHAPLIAVGSDDPNSSLGAKVVLFELSENSRKWLKVEALHSITEPVQDIAFSPNLGRSYHLLAVATKDLRILAITPLKSAQSDTFSLELRQAAQFDAHGGTVWRVSWNILGTILASSGDDGFVKLWKSNYMDVWKCISSIKGEEITLPTTTTAVSKTGSGFIIGSSEAKTNPTARYLRLAPTAHPSHVAWH